MKHVLKNRSLKFITYFLLKLNKTMNINKTITKLGIEKKTLLNLRKCFYKEQTTALSKHSH